MSSIAIAIEQALEIERAPPPRPLPPPQPPPPPPPQRAWGGGRSAFNYGDVTPRAARAARGEGAHACASAAR